MQSRFCSVGKVALESCTTQSRFTIQRASYSTTVGRLIPRPTTVHSRPTTIALHTRTTRNLPTKPCLGRCASTSANTAGSSAAAPAATSARTTSPSLTWNEFLKLRKTRRYVNLVASILAGLGSIAIATPLIAEYEIEDIGVQLTGLDPMFVIGGSLMAVGAVGWLLGPFLGNAFFKVWKSSIAREFAQKEKDFYAHIKRYRADPTSSSVNNPVPDYYGEKIGSVADYRRWLKDQRAFTRKKNKNMI